MQYIQMLRIYIDKSCLMQINFWTDIVYTQIYNYMKDNFATVTTCYYLVAGECQYHTSCHTDNSVCYEYHEQMVTRWQGVLETCKGMEGTLTEVVQEQQQNVPQLHSLLPKY